MSRFSGRVVAGRGEAASFIQLDWVRELFAREFGIDPFPGTLNLRLEEPEALEGWRALQEADPLRVDPPTRAWCSARVYAVRLAGLLPAAVVVPEVAAYPLNQVELVAAVPLRRVLFLDEGDRLTVERRGPLAVRAVLFDIDGTLVDSLTAYRIVAERAAAPHGLTITDELVREALNTTRSFWELAVPPRYPNRNAVIETLSREASQLWPEVLREHGRVFADAAPALHALRHKGLKLGIVTGSRRGSLEPLRQNGLLDLFETVITGSDVQRRKPDPEGLALAATALGVGTDEAVYVGDSPLDLQAARAAGMFSIGVLVGAGDSAALSACGPDHLASSLLRVPALVHPRGSAGSAL